MNSIIIPIVAVTVIGLICAIMLVVASKFMSVPEDERFTAIRECLPGANCGACGFTGCDGYAHALANGETKNTALCVPGASSTAAKVAEASGFEAGEVIPKVAYVSCCGEINEETQKHDYRGINTCAAAASLFSGYARCYHSCLGLGDCAAVCPNGAICFENGTASVNAKLCVGCGLCAKACPKMLIQIVPRTVRTLVMCSNNDKGANTRKDCSFGCIGCKKCEKNCPSGAIKVVNNCAVIDYALCTSCGKCAEVCTTGCIRQVDLGGTEAS